MDANGTTTNGSDNNGVLSNNIPDVLLSPHRQESLSESLLDSSELNDDTDIETMRQRIHEMEEEAEKLKQMQFEVDKQMQSPSATGTCKNDHSINFSFSNSSFFRVKLHFQPLRKKWKPIKNLFMWEM